jgi:putative transposase
VAISDNCRMGKSTTLYKRQRFPPDIIQYAFWPYHLFNLSQRDIQDLLAERGIIVSHESIRKLCNKFGPIYKRRLKRRHQGFGDIFYLDEVFVNIQGVQQYLWRAVDQDGEVIDVFLQKRRNGAAAKRFFKRLLKVFPGGPRKIVTDKLRSYGVAHRELMPEVIHDTNKYANNRVELSHQTTRVRERGMRGFKSVNKRNVS